jgi:phosphoglycerate dehydrogenase-like enzyme
MPQPVPAGIQVAILDVYPPPLRALVREKLPSAWGWRFAESYEPRDQHDVLSTADVAFANWGGVDAGAVASAPRLRLIHKLGAGVDKIDQAACREQGVAVARIGGGNATPVAEHTIMLMLAALRRLPAVDARTRTGEWFKEEARVLQRQLSGRRVGLVGLGAIGQAVARRLAGFEVTVVYFDPVRLPPEIEAELGVDYLELDTVLRTSDVISLHLPLSATTRGLLDADRIRALKPEAVVINCARGGLIDEPALLEALREGRLLAAGLDTFEKEPPVGNPLLDLPNTVVTAHVAGATFDNFGRMLERAVANTVAYWHGTPLPAGDRVF